MLDATPITTEITQLITAGTPEGELLARVVGRFPDLTPAELSAALQEATARAQRQATRRHCGLRLLPAEPTLGR
jgi:uncharacterized protein (DUF433 family)